MLACVILHNMILEDDGFSVADEWKWNIDGYLNRRIGLEGVLAEVGTFAWFLAQRMKI